MSPEDQVTISSASKDVDSATPRNRNMTWDRLMNAATPSKTLSLPVFSSGHTLLYAEDVWTR